MSQLTGSKKVTYPVVRSEIRTYNHANDSQLFEAHNIFHNQLPNSHGGFVESNSIQR